MGKDTSDGRLTLKPKRLVKKRRRFLTFTLFRSFTGEHRKPERVRELGQIALDDADAAGDLVYNARYALMNERVGDELLEQFLSKIIRELKRADLLPNDATHTDFNTLPRPRITPHILPPGQRIAPPDWSKVFLGADSSKDKK